MKKSDLGYILCVTYSTLTAFFYCCTIWFKIRLLRYYPLEHTWKWIKEPLVPSQGWYGMQAFAFLAAGVVTFIIYLVLKPSLRQQNMSLKPAWAKGLGVLSLIIILFCLGAMLQHEFADWGVWTALAGSCACRP